MTDGFNEQASMAGRTALVPGAASGVGRAVALRYARRGAHVIAFDISADGLAQLAGMVGEGASGTIEPATGDVRDRATLDAAVDGHDIDVVAAIAGISK